MPLEDKDLLSIQEARSLARKAKLAQKKLAVMNQQEIDRIVKAVADAGYEHRERLAKMASEETGFGVWQDKVIKNLFGSRVVYEKIKDLKTVGILQENPHQGLVDVAVPVGVVAALVPSTNPTSTVMYKTLIALKSANAIVFSPHPGALKSILETVKVLMEAAEQAGCPEGAIASLTIPALAGTSELMKHEDVSLILATGGSAMVRAAYSSGTPAIGVGPGNSPAFIERSADVPKAVKRILDSKTFDNGTICASEQSIVVEESMKQTVMDELVRQGAYFLSGEEKRSLSSFIMRANGSMNPDIVGKSVQHIAKLCGLNVPAGIRVLIGEEAEVGHHIPFSREKLAPILAFYTVKNAEEACGLCVDILSHEGAGHTFSMHSENQELIRKFALKIPASRFLVNTASSLGGIGGTTNLFPALTLGCGAVGGSSTSENIGPMDLINIKKIAWGVKELEDLRPEAAQIVQPELIEMIIKRVVMELSK